MVKIISGTVCCLLFFQYGFTQTVSNCASCSYYIPLIHYAVQQGEPGALDLLQSEIKTKQIAEDQKRHLLKYIANAKRSIDLQIPDEISLAARSPLNSLAETTVPADSLNHLPKVSLNQLNLPVFNGKPVAPSNTPVLAENHPFQAPNVNATIRQPDKNRQSNIETEAVDSFFDSEGQGDDFEINRAYREAGYSLDEPFSSQADLSQPQNQHEAALNGEFTNNIDIEDAYRSAGYSLDKPAESSVPPLSNTRESADTSIDSKEKYPLPVGAASLFSEKYLRIRQRYLMYFFFEGMTATTLKLKAGSDPKQISIDSVNTAEFADQTLHMGQALLTFSAESAILKQNGLDNSNSELIVKILLNAFQELDNADGLPEIYGVSKPGFFLRDFIHDGKRRGVPPDWEISSDSKVMLEGGPRHQAAMSLDQTVSLFVGWWAVAHYSSDADNRAQAQKQCDRVIRFLKDSLFFIKLPNGESIPSNRGPEFRYAAGFLCRIAEATTGQEYYGSSSIDVTIKGDPIRFRDNHLGEFEIPGYKIPATISVSLSHPLIVALKPAAIAVMTTPRIKIRFSDLFPGADPNVNLPCAHMVQAHPGGHTNMVACIHLTVKHSGGDLVATLPCAHMTKKHPNGDQVKCAHLTAKHQGGHKGPALPCAHIGKLHGSHTKKIGGIKVKVPCTHYGPKHPGGHTQTLPCTHLVSKHPNGHRVTCTHLTAKHPAGHKQYAPCIHPTAVHPAGDPVKLPCAHFEQAHPSGHGFDLTSLDIDVPLGEKMHPYTRHIVLQCFAFEPAVNGVTEFLPSAIASNHVWSALLRAQVLKDIPISLISTSVKNTINAMPENRGPDNQNIKPWTRSNRWERWERCTELEPSGDSPEIYNGLDYLGLVVLARLNGINQ